LLAQEAASSRAFITALGTLTIRIATFANVQGVEPLVHDTFSYTNAWLLP
jgi:hypothetical protein